MTFDYKKWQQEQEQQGNENKEKMYCDLASDYPNVVSIEVEYDGCGDDGNVEAPVCYDKDRKEVVVRGELSEGITQYVYDALEEHQGGWEINDGSYGTVSIDVPSRKAKFDHYDRYTDAENNPFED